jgi:hypothetical protein
LQNRNIKFSFDLQKGLFEHYEPIIASGSVLTEAPTSGQAMLMLLDSLQPWRETSLILDRHHILPMLGLLGENEPLLPVHVLNSEAFVNLGPVIPAISTAKEGETILTINVGLVSGKSYDVDISQGTLRRVLVPAGEPVVLALTPKGGTDVGEGPGVERCLKVTAGLLGVVIDARGRPLVLPEDDDERVARLRQWLWALGG